jgi:RecB family endonuclease NucS
VSDIKLFRVQAQVAQLLPSKASDLEKPLQTLIESNLDTLLGVRFLASEHPTGKTHGGRIDTMGIDEDNCPVILEYKRSVGENVINQGLLYTGRSFTFSVAALGAALSVEPPGL